MACAMDYYPNTDRMKTTVQHSPQIILEGTLLLPEPQTLKEVRANSFITREFIRSRQARMLRVCALLCMSVQLAELPLPMASAAR